MLFSILTSCIQQESQLEQAISQSGDNHIELEKGKIAVNWNRYSIIPGTIP